MSIEGSDWHHDSLQYGSRRGRVVSLSGTLDMKARRPIVPKWPCVIWGGRGSVRAGRNRGSPGGSPSQDLAKAFRRLAPNDRIIKPASLPLIVEKLRL